MFVDIIVYLCIFERVHEINNKLVGMHIRVMISNALFFTFYFFLDSLWTLINEYR